MTSVPAARTYRRVISPEDLNNEILAYAWDSARWTAVIPAAGRGTRLGSDRPKILYEIAGRTILEHLVELLSAFCSRIVFVLAPSGFKAVEPVARESAGLRADFAVQDHPVGMADAVRRGAEVVSTENTLVIWGDQVCISPVTVERLIRLHEGRLAPAATVPTLIRNEPYIHFQRDSCGRIARVLQKREGDHMPVMGENDCGLFLFRTTPLRERIPSLLERPECIGRLTREYNFLPILPLMESEIGGVVSARIISEEETVGVNTPEEAEFVANCIERRK